MAFEVGDKAYVPNHGVGIVKEIQDTEIAGASYRMYVIKILESGLTYSVPLQQVAARGIRAVIPAAQVEKVYDVLRDKETPADKQTWNRRYREYTHKIQTGDPLQVAAVLRELARLKSEKTLSFGERKMYDQAHSLIVQELAAARDVTEAVIKDEIEALFQQ
jgi:CarD family transcriptional regulator